MSRYLVMASWWVLAALVIVGCAGVGEDSIESMTDEAVEPRGEAVEPERETVVVEVAKEVVGKVPVGADGVGAQSETTADAAKKEAAALEVEAVDGETATLARQQRIVVRTVAMGLVVSGIQASMDEVAAVANGMGGWTVSSERSDDFSGNIAVRVPAERLDEAIARIRDIAVEVESEVTTSKDVTAEYFDSQSRLRNLRATATAMLNLLEQASDARDALDIRESLSEVQEEIEVLLGRLKLLEETSAFSLINVAMQVERVDLRVDAGPDRTVSIGQTLRFKANFRPPAAGSDYLVEWDFGDRSGPVTDTFTAATTQPGTRVTASISHVFDDYRDSPYFVDVRISGSSESSPLFGQDTIKVTVLDTEQMPVDAGEDQTTAVGRSVRFRAFFEPPADIDQFTYTWDFGDGSPPITGNRAILTEDSARMVTAVTHHAYGSALESPYIVQINMTGIGEAGVVEGSDKAVVTVTELPVLIVSADGPVTVEEGATAKLRGTFTRPPGVANMRYRWVFGDGSAPEEAALDEDSSAVEAHHEYLHQGPYAATLTITGESEVGMVEASSQVDVTVVEGRGWIVGGYDLQGDAKDAVRLLSTVARSLVTAAIWLIILSPIWAILLGAVIVLNRVGTRWGSRPKRPKPAGPEGAPEPQENPPRSRQGDAEA